VSAPQHADPWATQPEPRYLTRDDRIEAAAKTFALLDNAGNVEDTDRTNARVALDAAYPQVTTAAQLEALPPGTVIVSDTGQVFFRIDRKLSPYVWLENRNHSYGLALASSSASIAANAAIWGHVWTVVHQQVTA
jgi:hypothetical protein